MSNKTDIEANNTKLEAISSKMTAVQTKADNLPHSGSVTLNIYNQTTEPENKNGFWIKSNESMPTEFLDVNLTNNPIIDLNTSTHYSNDYLKVDNVAYEMSDAICVGDMVYYLAQYNSKTHILKFNTTTKQCLYEAEVPDRVMFHNYGTPEIVYLNGYLYMFSAENGYKSYKYNLSTQTFTEIQGIAHDWHFSIFTLNDRIFSVGGWQDGTHTDRYKIYEYDIVNNTWTQKFNNSILNGIGRAVVCNNKLYVFGVATNYTFDRVVVINYDSVNNTFTYNKEITKSQYPIKAATIVVVGDKIYLFGNDSNTKIYYIDTTDSTWHDTGYSVYNNYNVKNYGKYAILTESNGIFITLADNNGLLFYKVDYPESLQFDTNTFVVNQKDATYKTLIVNDNQLPICKFDEAGVYRNGKDTTIDVAYGNGTSWITLS